MATRDSTGASLERHMKMLKVSRGLAGSSRGERAVEGAAVVRFSLRLRDRALPDDASQRLYVDHVQLWQDDE